MTSPIMLLERGLEDTSYVVHNVTKDQLNNATPCADWTVRDLLNHIISGNRMMAAMARGEEPDMLAFGADQLGDDPAAAYDESAREEIAAWQTPGAMQRTYHLPFGDLPATGAIITALMDVTVHGRYDLAIATGQPTGPDADIAHVLAKNYVGQIPRDMRGPGAPFGPEIPTSPEAPDFSRLVAHLGRRPS